MKDVGSDLWTPPAVSIFKSKLQKTILNSLDDNLLNTSKTNGSTTTTNTSNGDSKVTPAENLEGDIVKEGDETETTPLNPTDEQGPKLVQAIFDLLYLDKILSVSKPSMKTPGLDDAIKDLRPKAGLEDASLERLRKSSGDYYKRTYLLFGLLAVG
ncbi:hypothetical protein KCU73_g17100, partial [Aureobasidium melanogenum]